MPKPLTVSDVADRVLHELIECYYSYDTFYMNSGMQKFFNNDEDAALFITNEEVIENIKRKLDDKYYLQVDNVVRLLHCYDPNDDFQFVDIKLEIKRKEDDD